MDSWSDMCMRKDHWAIPQAARHSSFAGAHGCVAAGPRGELPNAHAQLALFQRLCKVGSSLTFSSCGWRGVTHKCLWENLV